MDWPWCLPQIDKFEEGRSCRFLVGSARGSKPFDIRSEVVLCDIRQPEWIYRQDLSEMLNNKSEIRIWSPAVVKYGKSEHDFVHDTVSNFMNVACDRIGRH